MNLSAKASVNSTVYLSSYLNNIIEYIEDNKVQIAFVLEEQAPRLKIMHSNRKESNLQVSRVLPWAGPKINEKLSKDEITAKLIEHKKKREEIASNLDILDVWELAQGELSQATANWLTELVISNPSIDDIAAVGNALLTAKSYFRLQSPNFEIFNAEFVKQKIEQEEQAKAKEEFFQIGTSFFKTLFELSNTHKNLAEQKQKIKIQIPEAKYLEQFKRLILKIMANPDSQEHLPTWRQLTKGLGDDPNLALKLAIACNLVPEHYNFWLDRFGYEVEENWYAEYQDEIAQLLNIDFESLELDDRPFISIDSATTKDIDDAFFVDLDFCQAQNNQQIKLSVALACPALKWDFESKFNEAILDRASSLYLVEGTHHLLPELLATNAYSLLEQDYKPALVGDYILDQDANILDFQIKIAKVKLASNLNYADVQRALTDPNLDHTDISSAFKYLAELKIALNLAQKRLDFRISSGAVIIEREERELILHDNFQLELAPAVDISLAQLIVSEQMILINESIAKFALDNNFQLLFRTQALNLPKELAGVWTKADDIARIVKFLAPAILESSARSHSGMGLSTYCTVSSPLRRYPDLVNEAQILHYLKHKEAKWTKEELDQILLKLNPRLDSATRIQRFRNRYWKLLYFAQQDKQYLATICEANDNFVTVMLNEEQFQVRTKRNLLNFTIIVGNSVKVKLGRINPLLNDISIVSCIPLDQAESTKVEQKASEQINQEDIFSDQENSLEQDIIE